MTRHLFHGSRTPGLSELLPKRDTHPGAEPDSPPAVYAGVDPAYCAAHAFPGSSVDGVEIGFQSRIEDGQLVRDPVSISIPKNLAQRLLTPVSIYKLSAEGFEVLPHIAPEGSNFRSLSPVSVIEELQFPSVTEAVEAFGGKVFIRKE